MDKLDDLYENLDEIIKKEPSDLIKAMEDNIEAYYQLLIKEERVRINLRSGKGTMLKYDINMKDPLILLRFYYQARNTGLTDSQHWKTMKLYLIEENGTVIKEVNDTDTIESLKSDMSLAEGEPLPQLYFAYKRPERVEAQKQHGGNKRKRKKKKKAFPSRKKNNRKNRTKKKTLSK